MVRIMSSHTHPPLCHPRTRLPRLHPVLVVAAFACPLACWAQAAPAPVQSSPAAQRMQDDRLRMAADQRQQKMLQDADKLLQMAQQLKASVDKTDKNTLSVQVVKQAESIEKLARQVKDGMRQ